MDSIPSKRSRDPWRGTALIVAGPGSGKTRVITRRVACYCKTESIPAGPGDHLHQQGGAGNARPDRGPRSPKPRPYQHLSQFGARVLREYGHLFEWDRNFTVYDMMTGKNSSKSPQRMLDFPFRLECFQLWDRHQQGEKPVGFRGSLRQSGGRLLQSVRCQGLSPTRSVSGRPTPCDFDDLLFIPAQWLQKNKEFRAQLDDRWHHTLIDEYQDTNRPSTPSPANLISIIPISAWW